MIELKTFNENDVDRLVGWIPNKEICIQWAGPLYDFTNLKEKILADVIECKKINPKHMMFNVILQETSEIIGHIQLLNIDIQNGSALIGRVLIGNEKMRGKGIGEKLILNILQYGFNDLHLHKMYLNVYDFNLSAIRCYEKAGLKRDGRNRDCMKIDNTYWSSIGMSILENEYFNQGNL